MMEVLAVIAWIVLSVIASAIARSLFPKKRKLAFVIGYVGVVAAGLLLTSILYSIDIQPVVLATLVSVLLMPALIIGFVLLLFSPIFLLIWLRVPGYRREDQPISRREYEQFIREYEQFRRDLEVERRIDEDT